MSWQEGVAVAVVLLGLGAGAFLVAQRPSFWLEFGMRLGEALLPALLHYATRRMPPRDEAAWRDAERREQGDGWLRERAAAKFWQVSEITNTDQISAIIPTDLVRNEVDDRATMSQKSSLPQVTRFVEQALMPDKSLVGAALLIACGLKKKQSACSSKNLNLEILAEVE